MAKRTQPKLSRPKADVITNALQVAARHDADRLLGRLHLSSLATTADARWMWKNMAIESARNIKDFCALTDEAPEFLLRMSVEGKPGHAFFLGQALAMLDEAPALDGAA